MHLVAAHRGSGGSGGWGGWLSGSATRGLGGSHGVDVSRGPRIVEAANIYEKLDEDTKLRHPEGMPYHYQ